MTKLEISRNLADQTGLPLTDAQRITDSMFHILKDALTNGSDIFVRGFGTFKVVYRKPKPARDIRKGTAVVVPARKTIKFIPSDKITIKQ